MRKIVSRHLTEGVSAEQLLAWGERFEFCVLLNSNTGIIPNQDAYHRFDFLMACGELECFTTSDDPFELLKKVHTEKKDWLITLFSYDLKNKIEKLSSENYDGLNNPEFLIVRPRYLVSIEGDEISFHFDESEKEINPQSMLNDILHSELRPKQEDSYSIRSRVERADYITAVNHIKDHIQRGDIYEMNYCQEFFSEQATIDPIYSYLRLNSLSPMPFSVFLKHGKSYLLSASPERYLAGRGHKLISQPIKGTARRGKSEEEDSEIKNKLQHDPKEQSENVMIVDLVRNDLSRTAARGSVRVEELFGIRTYTQLHQMVSTIVSEKGDDFHPADVIRTSFPMGSMTGAPKIRAMEIIEENEKTKRGWYSGSVGYMMPSGDFDLNVIIRSMLYNSENGYLSYMAGSAITIGSKAEKEYEECLLKAGAFFNLAQ